MSSQDQELAGLMRQVGAKRVTEDGISFYRVPAWLCPHCTPIGGPETEPLPGCPCPIARHGPILTHEEWKRRREEGAGDDGDE